MKSLNFTVGKAVKTLPASVKQRTSVSRWTSAWDAYKATAVGEFLTMKMGDEKTVKAFRGACVARGVKSYKHGLSLYVLRAEGNLLSHAEYKKVREARAAAK